MNLSITARVTASCASFPKKMPVECFDQQEIEYGKTKKKKSKESHTRNLVPQMILLERHMHSVRQTFLPQEGLGKKTF
jgi:hypothetical protein